MSDGVILFPDYRNTCWACFYVRDGKCAHPSGGSPGKVVAVTDRDGKTRWSEACSDIRYPLVLIHEERRAANPETNELEEALAEYEDFQKAHDLLSRDERLARRVAPLIEFYLRRALDMMEKIATSGSIHAVMAREATRERVRSILAQRARPNSSHIPSCDEAHVHTAPKCCSPQCWCRTYGR